MNDLNQLGRSAIPESMNNEQTRFPNDAVRDLPPKSPSSKRLIQTIPTKVKRGEVKTYSECEYMRA
jgi:hypothetical protein